MIRSVGQSATILHNNHSCVHKRYPLAIDCSFCDFSAVSRIKCLRLTFLQTTDAFKCAHYRQHNTSTFVQNVSLHVQAERTVMELLATSLPGGFLKRDQGVSTFVSVTTLAILKGDLWAISCSVCGNKKRLL